MARVSEPKTLFTGPYPEREAAWIAAGAVSQNLELSRRLQKVALVFNAETLSARVQFQFQVDAPLGTSRATNLELKFSHGFFRERIRGVSEVEFEAGVRLMFDEIRRALSGV